MLELGLLKAAHLQRRSEDRRLRRNDVGCSQGELLRSVELLPVATQKFGRKRGPNLDNDDCEHE